MSHAHETCVSKEVAERMQAEGVEAALRSAVKTLADETKQPPHMLSDSAQRVWMGGMDAAGRIVHGLALAAARARTEGA